MNKKTFSAKKEEIKHSWHIIDAENQIVGHVAEKAAVLLRGKHKPTYTPHLDSGDNVIIINAAKAVFTGSKETKKKYTSYSGYVGGHKSESPASRRNRRPTLILESAVKGMIPHNRLGRMIFKKLFVYAEASHPHEAQQPQESKM